MSAGRPRAAYRAIYLSSPLKFHTTLHAFTRTLPRFHVEAWKKDPTAWEKYKFKSAKMRRRGRWNYAHGPLSGVQLEGWPEPGLLGKGPLVQLAARAQEERLEDYDFWQQVAERTYKLRDVLSVGDLVVILDALVTADHRHLLVLKTFARELIDDADKMLLVEVAVVMNAYSHFNCSSQPLMEALSAHVVRLLSDDPPPFAQHGGDVDGDPNCLAVLLKSFTALDFRRDDLFQAVGIAAVQRAESLSFAALADILPCFVRAKKPFLAGPEFWAVVASKVPGGRMASLCPAFQAVVQLDVDSPKLQEALLQEIVKGLKDVPSSPLPQPFGTAFRLWDTTPSSPAPLPTFPVPRMPKELLALAERGRTHARSDISDFSEVAGGEGAAIVEFPSDPFSMIGGEILPGGEVEEVEPAFVSRKKSSWYSATARCPLSPVSPEYAEFDADETFNRNRRGARVGEALEGLNDLWRRRRAASGKGASRVNGANGVAQPALASGEVASTAGSANGAAPAAKGHSRDDSVALQPTAGSSRDFELQLLQAALPVVQTSLPGLSARQLVACAELCAAAPAQASEDTLRDVVQEAIRKLSTFQPKELRRLREATLQRGTPDPYLERARRRRFPKTLRKELRDEEAAAGVASAAVAAAAAGGSHSAAAKADL